MIFDTRVYDGETGTWHATLEIFLRPSLLERAGRMPEWITFIWQGGMYYRTFENHIYRVEAVAR